MENKDILKKIEEVKSILEDSKFYVESDRATGEMVFWCDVEYQIEELNKIFQEELKNE